MNRRENLGKFKTRDDDDDDDDDMKCVRYLCGL
jgi:hypothetical protein